MAFATAGITGESLHQTPSVRSNDRLAFAISFANFFAVFALISSCYLASAGIASIETTSVSRLATYPSITTVEAGRFTPFRTDLMTLRQVRLTSSKSERPISSPSPSGT